MSECLKHLFTLSQQQEQQKKLNSLLHIATQFSLQHTGELILRAKHRHPPSHSTAALASHKIPPILSLQDRPGMIQTSITPTSPLQLRQVAHKEPALVALPSPSLTVRPAACLRPVPTRGGEVQGLFKKKKSALKSGVCIWTQMNFGLVCLGTERILLVCMRTGLSRQQFDTCCMVGVSFSGVPCWATFSLPFTWSAFAGHAWHSGTRWQHLWR